MVWDYMIPITPLHDGTAASVGLTALERAANTSCAITHINHITWWMYVFRSFLVRRFSGISADFGGARRIPRDCRTPPVPLRGRCVALSIHIVTNISGI